MVHFTVMDFEQLSWENNFISDCSLPIDKFEDEDGNLYYIVRNNFIHEGQNMSNKDFVLKFIIGAFAGELTHGNVVKQRYFTGHSRGCSEDEPVALFSAFIDIKKGRTKHSLQDYYDMEKDEGETIVAFCKRKNMGEELFLTMLLDYICGNVDRAIQDFYIYENDEGEMELIVPTFCTSPQFQNPEVHGVYQLTGEDLFQSIKNFHRKAYFCDNLKSMRRLTPKIEMLNNVFNEEEIAVIGKIIQRRLKKISPYAKTKLVSMFNHYRYAILTYPAVLKLRYFAFSLRDKIRNKRIKFNGIKPDIHDNVN